MTKKEKIAILKSAKYYMNNPPSSSPHYDGAMCTAILSCRKGKGNKPMQKVWQDTCSHSITIKKFFPELMKHKPESTYSDLHWFPPSDKKSRNKVFNATIKELGGKP